ARLVQLQGFESTKYAAEGQLKRLRNTVLLAQRGQILDRNGAQLAMSQEARTITADPLLVTDADAAAAALAPLLNLPAADIKAKLTAKGRYAIIAKAVDVPLAQNIMELKLPGISYERTTRRIYPNDALASSLVGFVRADGTGAGGIESKFDKALRGTDGRMIVEQAAAGVISSGVRKVVDAKAGGSVQLTIDRDIQWMAQKTLLSEVQRSGAAGGHIIVMDVKTGEILALASAPTFDPNATSGADPKTLGSITAVSNVYEPGSVNKVITAAAALETGLLGPDSTVVVPTSITVADKTFREHGARAEQHLTFRGVLAKSSNVGTITIAQRLGKEKIDEYLRKFGLGSLTGVDLPGESRGLLPPVQQWSGSQVGNIPIGQGVAATALQMAEVYAIVANGGVKVTPTMVKGQTDSAGTFSPAAPPVGTRVIKESSAAMLREMLEAVTSDGGTAPGARIDGYRVAGKTGTARRVLENGLGYDPGKYVSSFIGFAPADKPELLVEVVLDRTGSGDYYAGKVSTPAFRDVMSFALAARKVAPTTEPPPVPRLTADPK
ncbi:MAG: penicillin-binding protein 2, partial [Actinomycetota bacterium]